ncbi:ABC transporter permease [Chitinophaga ginsengisegetis]|uniref:ABC transporter permease n=1 Tax=Chitinophaga ginsengisegetis TaxID=393003 RepID=UPI000DBA3EB6|nr:ABC transporter permease [Chitinophaga ginsengisegetis]MDR6569070.1 ABC-type antimicrobial peptide transport system permease subunit [Chitinophaga ginsengisegetis]MDR6648901.1 ABC-type antimicrobial peptide transport system permease subunit [Chitinophaga ginsengisegetis]MDR6655151.1 ABC-type antimicrobial peptide transport system permease subunit [Chitinophaga ginsengisegetis]
MIRNYFRIAWRNLVRNKAFSFINILGLALGLACSLLMILWVQDEKSMDGFHANSDKLYQVYVRQSSGGKVDAGYLTQGPLAAELKKEVPEVAYASGFQAFPPVALRVEDKVMKITGAYAGADFLQMFSYPVLAGTKASAIDKPGTIAISRHLAELFFGSPEQALGKTLRYEDTVSLSVTSVYDVPANSSQQFDFLRNWEDFTKNNAWTKTWGSFSPLTYIRLRDNADAGKVAAKIKDFVYNYQPRNNNSYTELGLQPYSEKYLHAVFSNGIPDGGRIEYVRLFTLLAIFIMLIACINFMNLATARSVKRAKEVGVRKVVGALRSSLIMQFIGEAMLLAFFSLVIALLVVILLLPAFNQLSGKQLSLPISQPVFWATLLGLTVLTGFVAGSYPALFLSSLNPVRVLKGSLKFGSGATNFRKGLVVFQFTLSILLMIGMFVIYRQMDYVQTKNLGYDRQNLIYIPIEGSLISKYDVFKETAANLPGVLAISKMKETPTVIQHHKGDISWSGKDPDDVPSFADAAVGYDFIKTMHLTLLEGRDFSREFGNDSGSYILNESAVKRIGYQHPVGQPFTLGNVSGTIVGVLKDFHFNSMHDAIEPLVIRLDEKPKWGTVLVRAAESKTTPVLAGLAAICKNLNPEFPFTYQFSDEEYTKLYKSEQMVGQLCNYFACLAVFISCLGLFGLAMFTAAQRTKEIGVRKVLGASESNIFILLSAGFLKPVFIGMLIAFPLAWYIMNHWLEHFAYKTDLEWWIFAGAGLITIIIALLTVSFQSIRAAAMNPVKSLKTE